jgi:hypothetical protein
LSTQVDAFFPVRERQLPKEKGDETMRKLRVLGGLVVMLAAALGLAPGAASAVTVNVQLVINTPTDDVTSSLNPASPRFDQVFEAGSVKSADGTTTFGTFMWVVTRSTGANANFFDGVIVLTAGNIFIKLVNNFSTGVEQGIIVGGDGSFKGVTGTILRVSGNTFQITAP